MDRLKSTSDYRVRYALYPNKRECRSSRIVVQKQSIKGSYCIRIRA